MNYLALSFKPKNIYLSLMDKDQVVKGTSELAWDKTAVETSIQNLKTKLTELTWHYQGISLIQPELTLDPTGCFTNEQAQQLHFQTYLQEELNAPVILASDLGFASVLEAQFAAVAEQASWFLTYYGYTPGKKEYAVESLLTTGNGFIGIRGTLPEMEISADHYPATYLAGLYNEIESEIGGQIIKNEDFVNSPNLQYISLVLDNGELLEITPATVQSMRRELALRQGLFSSQVILETSSGRQVEIKTQRIVNMASKNHISLRYQFTPLNFSGRITVITKSDGSIYNYNVDRYRSLSRYHLEITQLEAQEEMTTLSVKTKQSQLEVVQHSQLVFDFQPTSPIENQIEEQQIIQNIHLDVAQGQAYTIEKNIQVNYFKPAERLAGETFKKAPGTFKHFAENLQASENAWHQLWQEADIQVSGDLMSQKLLRLHTYHLLVSGSPFAQGDLDTSITARGLHGEAYRGHIFWDEIFILPFYILHFPETAKELLNYRYQRLETAKENAQANGYRGAMFPWQSGLTGEEQTQELHLNPLSGEWGEDYSRLQRHVSLAVAYNVWLYWLNTGDTEFMSDYGGELMLEIGEFWQSKSHWNQTSQRYDITGVMGPDEFHEAYPNSEVGGINNNAYTNLMVSWLFAEIANLPEVIGSERFAELLTKTKISEGSIKEMAEIRRKLSLEIDSAGRLAQYEGYFDLKEVDWEYYQEKYGNVYRMDRILRAEGQSADDYQVAKQADTLMTFYNLAEKQVTQLLSDLNYPVPADYLSQNLNYYLARTSHGSTLSRIVHSQLAEMVGKKELSWQLYQEALRSDYQDIQGGTTAEGIHTGVMAATLYVTLTTYAGLEIRQNELALKPDLPAQWEKLAFNFKRQGINYKIEIGKDYLSLEADRNGQFSLNEEQYQFTPGEKLKLTY